MHNIILGCQPDFLHAAIDTWQAHGREIEAGDAEKVLDQTPSVVHRAPSVGSGEHFYQVNYSMWMNGVPGRGILGVVHNLQDVGARVRVTHFKSTGYELVHPTSTIASSNTAATHATITGQDPYGSVTNFATPTVQTTDFYLEVGFANTDPLQLDVEDSQIILVYLKAQGDHSGGPSLTAALIEVKEGSTVRASKQIRMRLADEEVIIISVLVDPNDFSDNTLAGMSVRVTSNAPSSGGAFFNWDFGVIAWQKFEQPVTIGSFGLNHDTGWVDVEAATEDMFHAAADAQMSSILPYLDANGEVLNLTCNMLRVLFTWDETSLFNGVSFDQRDRIYADNDGGLTEWRPEIGVVAEGPAWGHRGLMFGQKSGFNDRSQVFISKGGNRWVIRKTPSRTLENVSVQNVEAVEFVENVYSVVRRVGVGQAFCVCIRPDTPEVSAACSLYGTLTSFAPAGVARGKPPDEETMVDLMGVTMSFEEVV